MIFLENVTLISVLSSVLSDLDLENVIFLHFGVAASH